MLFLIHDSDLFLDNNICEFRKDEVGVWGYELVLENVSTPEIHVNYETNFVLKRLEVFLRHYFFYVYGRVQNT